MLASTRRHGAFALWTGAIAAALLATASPRPSPAASSGTADEVRYTLTVVYKRADELHVNEQRCFLVDPPGGSPGAAKLLVCTKDMNDQRAAYSSVARSTAPFVLRRSDLAGAHFSFTTPVAGTDANSVSGSAWSLLWTHESGYVQCTYTDRGGHEARVTGTVSLEGINPARLRVDLSATGAPPGSYTKTSDCSNGDSSTEKSGQGVGGSPSWWLKRVDLRKAFGRAFTVTDSRVSRAPLVHGTRVAKETWTFRFTPVAEEPERQRWQIDVRGADRWSWGERAGGPGAGVWVSWLHRSLVDVEDGKVTAATGQVVVESVRPFSDPPDAFTVTPAATGGPEYDLKLAALRGNRLTIGLLREPESAYTVRFTLRLTGPGALDRLREAKVPFAEELYARLTKRGPIDDRVTSLVPAVFRFTVPLQLDEFYRKTESYSTGLPCARFGADEADCILRRGAERVTVTPVG